MIDYAVHVGSFDSVDEIDEQLKTLTTPFGEDPFETFSAFCDGDCFKEWGEPVDPTYGHCAVHDGESCTLHIVVHYQANGDAQGFARGMVIIDHLVQRGIADVRANCLPGDPPRHHIPFDITHWEDWSDKVRITS